MKTYLVGDDAEQPKIAMLLNIENYYGEHEGRLAPVLYTLIGSLMPVLLYVYFSLWRIIPIWLFIPLEIFFAIRLVMIIPGREKYRLEMFRRQLYDEYTSTANLVNIRTIHPDGCIEYTNGNIAYIVTAYNGTILDDIQHTREVRKFISNCVGEYAFDIYVHNITSSALLNDYYKKISNFDKNESATNFIKIIDHNKELIKDNSMLQCIVIVVKGKRTNWKDIRQNIDNTLHSHLAKCFKFVNICSDERTINDVIDRNIDTSIDINALLRRKYKTDEFNKSHVIDFDVSEDDIIVEGKSPTTEVLPKASSKTFHVAFKESDSILNKGD